MYEIEFYEDKNGKSEVADFIKELSRKSSAKKDSRINFNKIVAYLDLLEEFGTRVGESVTKHLEGEIWELRPLRNRFLYAYYKDNKFIILHHFIKKTQKTPKRELEQAKKNLADYFWKGMVDMPTWNELKSDLSLSQEDLNAIELEKDLIRTMIKIREEKGLTQSQLAEMCNVKQPVIARMESSVHSPQIDSLLRILTPLGYTLQIVPIAKKQ